MAAGVLFLTCQHNLVICRQPFSGHALPTEYDQIPGERTDDVCTLARARLQSHVWPYPVLQPDWIPGSCPNMLDSFISLGLWSQSSFLVWDLFSPGRSARQDLFIFQDSDPRRLHSSHALIPSPTPAYTIRLTNLFFISTMSYTFGECCIRFASFYVFIFILDWKNLRPGAMHFFSPSTVHGTH